MAQKKTFAIEVHKSELSFLNSSKDSISLTESESNIKIVVWRKLPLLFVIASSFCSYYYCIAYLYTVDFSWPKFANIVAIYILLASFKLIDSSKIINE